MQESTNRADKPQSRQQTIYRVLMIISLAHLLNDTIQSLVPAMFPILKDSIGLSFMQLGFIAFALNITSSIIQPLVGYYTDKKPSPYALPIGLSFTFIGVLGLAFAQSFGLLLFAVSLVGLGSATFHPEGSRVAYMAAGRRRGFAQSIYQVGGHSGQAFAPIITALILVPLGQFGAIWFTIAAGLAIILLLYIARWYSNQVKIITNQKKRKQINNKDVNRPHRKKVIIAMTILLFVIFARTWFHAGLTNFYAFYVIDQYGLTIKEAQIYLFVFLAFGAIGTFAGGPLADRFGKKMVIMASMILAAPLALLLPYSGMLIAYPLLALIGFIVLTSFSVAVVYAQELMPGRIGMVAGLVVGLAFGMGGIGSILFGTMADHFGITTTMVFIAFLPILGITSLFLPSDQWISKHIKNDD